MIVQQDSFVRRAGMRVGNLNLTPNGDKLDVALKLYLSPKIYNCKRD